MPGFFVSVADIPGEPEMRAMTATMPHYHRQIMNDPHMQVQYHLSGYGLYNEEALVKLMGESVERYAAMTAIRLFDDQFRYATLPGDQRRRPHPAAGVSGDIRRRSAVDAQPTAAPLRPEPADRGRRHRLGPLPGADPPRRGAVGSGAVVLPRLHHQRRASRPVVHPVVLDRDGGPHQPGPGAAQRPHRGGPDRLVHPQLVHRHSGPRGGGRRSGHPAAARHAQARSPDSPYQVRAQLSRPVPSCPCPPSGCSWTGEPTRCP